MDDSNRTVSVSEAAAALGISTDAVRKRLERGTLQGEKVSGRWAVTLPDDVADNETQPETPSGQHPVDIDAMKLIAEYAAAAAMWQERARNLETQLLALQPGDVPENEATESTETGDSDATGINTHAETERATQSRWARFLALFKPE